MTIHISATPGDIAETVLMPGDPLRAKALAMGHLDDVRQVNSVRNMLGFTGTFQGRPVSIMGSGMGMPSIGIYAHELFEHYGVQRIVRVGTCGALLEDMCLGDLVLATAACTDSNMNRQRFSGWDLSAAADFDMLRCVWDAASEANQAVLPGWCRDVSHQVEHHHQTIEVLFLLFGESIGAHSVSKPVQFLTPAPAAFAP